MGYFFLYYSIHRNFKSRAVATDEAEQAAASCVVSHEAEGAKNRHMHFPVRKYSPKCFSFWVTSYTRICPEPHTWLRPGPHKGLHHPDPFAFPCATQCVQFPFPSVSSYHGFYNFDRTDHTILMFFFSYNSINFNMAASFHSSIL